MEDGSKKEDIIHVLNYMGIRRNVELWLMADRFMCSSNNKSADILKVNVGYIKTRVHACNHTHVRMRIRKQAHTRLN